MGYRSRSRLLRYSVAMAVVALAAALRWWLAPALGASVPFIIFFPAVLVAAWYGGPRAGAAAVVASSVVSIYFFLGPRPGFDPLDPVEQFALLLFVLGAAAMVLVTDRLHREQARSESSLDELRRQRERFESIVTSIPGVVWEAWGRPDAHEQHIDYVSPYVETLLGYTVEEWAGRPNFWLTIVHPDDREGAAARATAIFAGAGPAANEFRWVARDGRILWVQAYSSPILDRAGKPVGMRGVTLDASARKEAEERLRLVSEVSEGFGDIGLRVRGLADRIAQRTTEVLGQACTIRVLENGKLRRLSAHHRHPDGQKLFDALALNDAVAEGVYRKVVEERRTRVMPVPESAKIRAYMPPELRPLLDQVPVGHAATAPLISRGHVFGAMAVWRPADVPFTPHDIQLLEAIASRAALALENATLYERAEKALASAERESRAKDEFLTTLSHELRTPLNAIMGWAHMLKEGHLDAVTTQKATETIARNAMIQAQLVADILDMQRVVSGKMRLDPGRVDLTEVVKAAADTVRPSAEARQIEVRLDLDPTAAPAWGDAERLQQVVWNLLANAIKFTPRGGRVDVRLRSLGSQVEIVVQDDGPGIAADFLPFVFDRFRQADSSATRQHGGLGLGLSIVRALVELHGGTVHAANTAGGTGAVLTVHLPKGRALASGPGDARDGTESGTGTPLWLEAAPSLRGISVLVVEDDTDGRDLVVHVLARCGAEVVAAASAGDAFIQLGRRAVDVIVCDIHMPDLDGHGFMRRLRQFRPEEGGRIPAAALTASASEADRAQALSAGFQRHLAKPVQPAELAVAVASLALPRGPSGDREADRS